MCSTFIPGGRGPMNSFATSLCTNNVTVLLHPDPSLPTGTLNPRYILPPCLAPLFTRFNLRGRHSPDSLDSTLPRLDTRNIGCSTITFHSSSMCAYSLLLSQYSTGDRAPSTPRTRLPGSPCSHARVPSCRGGCRCNRAGRQPRRAQPRGAAMGSCNNHDALVRCSNNQHTQQPRHADTRSHTTRRRCNHDTQKRLRTTGGGASRRRDGGREPCVRCRATMQTRHIDTSLAAWYDAE